MTSKSTWTQFERDIAKAFGSHRNPLSGRNSRRDDGSQRPGDVISDEWLVECKLRAQIGLFRLWEELMEDKAATNSDLPPVLFAREKGNRKQVLAVLHANTFFRLLYALREHQFDFRELGNDTFDFAEFLDKIIDGEAAEKAATEDGGDE